KWERREFSIRSQPNYPLAVDVYGGPALLIKILYHGHCFEHAAIHRMLGHFRTLLEGLTVGMEQRLRDVPMLTEADRHQLLVKWNNTHAECPKDKCTHHLFEDQAQRTPDALAVADDRQQLTFRELNERANVLAWRLQVLGVGPD